MNILYLNIFNYNLLSQIYFYLVASYQVLMINLPFVLKRRNQLELLLKFIGASRKTKRCRDRTNGDAMRANGESGLDCSQAVAAGMLPAPCPCVPWWDGFPWDPAQGARWEQILAQILAVNWAVLTHTPRSLILQLSAGCASPWCAKLQGWA